MLTNMHMHLQLWLHLHVCAALATWHFLEQRSRCSMHGLVCRGSSWF